MRILLLVLVFAGTVHAIDFKKYHSQAEINAYLREVAGNHPELVTFEVLGESDQGRELSYVTITKAEPGSPAIYLNGTHHGNEKSSTESMLAIIDHLLSQSATAEIDALLRKYIFIVQPLVNADGHHANTREDAYGRDPNRDYSYPGQQNAFKISFIQLVRDLMRRYQIRAAIAYHSGMEGILWPWCSTSAATSIKDTFYTLSKTAAQAMGMSLYKQSYHDYPSYGEFIDYAFMTYGTLAVTFEVSSQGNPPASQLESVVKRAVKGTFAYIDAVAKLDAGRLAVEREPIATRVSFNPLFERLGRKLE